MQTKPANSRWTDEQWRAITEQGRDILVAAAAGSGKTAVLVERIIRRMTDPDNPTGIDDLLVVTFTKAAASEMKERIGKALDQEIAEHPESLYLRRQQALLSKASIITLHAFCMSVVKRYYYFLDLDPSFRMLDETESVLLRDEVLSEVLEERYGSGDPEFYRLVDRYSDDRSDDHLERLILKLYDFSRSHPWPEEWLNQMVLAYQTEGKASIDDFGWAKELKKGLKRKIDASLAALDEARRLCEEPGGPKPYAVTLAEDREGLKQLASAAGTDWESLRASFAAFSFGKLKPCRGKEIDDALKDEVRSIREQVKRKIGELQQQWFGRTSEEHFHDLKDMASSVLLLKELVQDFSERFKKEKRKRGLLDFSDLEHDCLTILRREDSAPGDEHPSVVAEQYRAQFAEVLVDEYQDTNRVQESILRLVSGGGPGSGHLFMVGDVKQSIYGFRLAEPGLFLEKYKRFSRPETSGVKIDLSRNFRSRREVIQGINFLFSQTMDEEVGGVLYDDSAKLRCGARYPGDGEAVELEIIDRSDNDRSDGGAADDAQAIELEARAIADRIGALTGREGTAFQVFDRKRGSMRPIRFRDIAVLLRSASRSAGVVMDVLKERGIPAYAELATGYFDTVEISVMLSVLKIIDNPLQDIPLASVLRSPIVGLNEDSLAAVRMADRTASYFQAMRLYTRSNKDHLADRLNRFLARLGQWRDFAKNHSVAALIWQIYQDTGYYDYTGGQAGGTQRQANLKALYDRARQFESTSFRGLFRFLRFIERMRENGGDLGEARVLSEQEDVVRVMTIHKSKGLEFPVVFVAGCDKKFNLKDTNEPALLHKTLGLGTRWIDPERRMSVPTLPYLVIKEQIRKETVAEEMRILYVAMTRAKEKLILLGSAADAKKRGDHWRHSPHTGNRLLPAYQRASATSFLDWIGPCVFGNRETMYEPIGEAPDRTAGSEDLSSWSVCLIPAGALAPSLSDAAVHETDKLTCLKDRRAVKVDSGMKEEVRRRLEWTYPALNATLYMAKQTVTEIKRQQEYFNEGLDDRMLAGPDRLPKIGGNRPRFLQRRTLSPAERGTALHVLMQHLDLRGPLDRRSLRDQGLRLVEKEILTSEQEESLDYEAVSQFFQTDVGRKMRLADQVTRECPFSLVLDADKVYPEWEKSAGREEKVLVQGVIDCIVEDQSGILLLDYKTDQLSSRFSGEPEIKRELYRRYHVQLDLYRTAIEQIWRRPVAQVGLYAFDGGYFLDMTSGKLREDSSNG
ncbi:helicase-exonuclease AddAB subunit AddA [Sporolactobacillus sp. THM7-7]|nr:helicase-exonuclease AddAB subunit AddA [Sporolactobacillus sp. THM7-7]